MKNKYNIINKFLNKFDTYQVDNIVWYMVDGKDIYSEDVSANCHGQKKYFNHKLKKFYTTRRFAQYIVRLNKIKAFW